MTQETNDNESMWGKPPGYMENEEQAGHADGLAALDEEMRGMPLARRAIRVHDRDGEITLLSYLLFARAQDGPQGLWENAGCCVLRDGSIVRRLNRPHPT